MKSVVISIQPKWCELIASGEKTVEVRKTKPKIDTTFKCYIYCTKDKNGWFDFEKKERLDGKIIGEFVCDDICEYMPYKWRDGGFEGLNYMYNPTLCYESRLSQSEIIKYGNRGKVYGWHISELVIYDKPKEINEFYRKKITNGYTTEWNIEGIVHYPKKEIVFEEIKTPPQSWCYVEE